MALHLSERQAATVATFVPQEPVTILQVRAEGQE